MELSNWRFYLSGRRGLIPEPTKAGSYLAAFWLLPDCFTGSPTGPSSLAFGPGAGAWMLARKYHSFQRQNRSSHSLTRYVRSGLG